MSAPRSTGVGSVPFICVQKSIVWELLQVQLLPMLAAKYKDTEIGSYKEPLTVYFASIRMIRLFLPKM
jgi:hypothetical protein